jgi:hypothetical protein
MRRGPKRADIPRAMQDRSLAQGEKGFELLFEHCSALTDHSRPPAFHRLEQALGGELARLLVGALARRRGERTAALLV